METAVFTEPHAELIERCKQGDHLAQFELYKRYSKAMLNTGMRMVNNLAEAEDILQESFLQAFGRMDEFRGASSFGLWLKKIVVNRSIDVLRKRTLILEDIDHGVINNIPAIEDDHEEETALQVNEVRKAIELLPDGFRVVLSLYLLEGYDHEEIAQILKISETTSRTQYMRAKKKLLSIISERRKNHER